MARIAWIEEIEIIKTIILESYIIKSWIKVAVVP